MACPSGYIPCGRGCGGCVPSSDEDGMHDECDPALMPDGQAIELLIPTVTEESNEQD